MPPLENDAQGAIYGMLGDARIDRQARELVFLPCNRLRGAEARSCTGCFAFAFSGSDFADIGIWNDDAGVLPVTIPDAVCVCPADADGRPGRLQSAGKVHKRKLPR